MPLYEYQCDACGRQFEVISKFSDPPLETCPTCGGAVHKLVSSPAFQFKGTGWYITDYAKKDQATAAQPTEAKSDDTAAKDKDKGEKSGEKSEKSEKSESKTETKSSDSTPAATPTSTSSPNKDSP